VAQKSNRLQQNYTKVQLKQTGPQVGVSFKRETPTPTPVQKPDSGGLRLHTHGYCTSED